MYIPVYIISYSNIIPSLGVVHHIPGTTINIRATPSIPGAAGLEGKYTKYIYTNASIDYTR